MKNHRTKLPVRWIKLLAAGRGADTMGGKLPGLRFLFPLIYFGGYGSQFYMVIMASLILHGCVLLSGPMRNMTANAIISRRA